MMQRFKHARSSEKTRHPVSNLEESVRRCVFLRMMYFLLSKLLLLRYHSTVCSSSVRNTFFVSFVCSLSLLYTSFSVLNGQLTKTGEKNMLGQHVMLSRKLESCWNKLSAVP